MMLGKKPPSAWAPRSDTIHVNLALPRKELTMPKNHRQASKPPKFFTTTTISVLNPKHSIISGKVRLGPKRLLAMPTTGPDKT